MIEWYLVLYILSQGSAMTTIRSPYDTKDQCEEAAKAWDSSFYGQRHICIRAFIETSKGYVCQPGASVCQMVK